MNVPPPAPGGGIAVCIGNSVLMHITDRVAVDYVSRLRQVSPTEKKDFSIE
jgi:hypothetical protein